MDKRTLALGLACGALVFYGCDGGDGTGDGVLFDERDMECEAAAMPPCPTTANVHTDEERTAPAPMTMADTTLNFVVNFISLPEATADGDAVGFNVDMLDSGQGSTSDDADCQEYQPDYNSLLDSDLVGVDNGLQGLVGAIESFLDKADCGGTTAGCLDRTLLRQTTEGDLILILQITGINDFEYDQSVTLQFVQGSLPEGTTPMLGADGRLAPDQTFGTVMAIGEPVAGDIFQGRLRAQATVLNLPIDTGDFALTLTVTNPEVRFDISEGGLINGAIGGYINNSDIITAADMLMEGGGELVQPILEGVADVTPNAANPRICDRLSVGIAFAATSAVVTP